MSLPDHIRLLKVPFGQRYIHLVLLRGERSLLVDSGMSCSFELHVLPGLTELGVSPAELDWLVNLHAHGDHIGGNALLLEASQGHLLIACHKADAPYIREPVRVVRDLYGMPEDHPRFRSSVESCGRPAPVHLELVAGVVFDLENGVKAEIVAAPGHSPGNIAVYDRASRVLIHGESIMGVPQRMEDGRLSAPFGIDPLVYRRTLERLHGLPIEVLVPSHQDLMTGDEAKALIEECIAGVDAYVDVVRAAVEAGATTLDAVYATVSRGYSLRGPDPLGKLYQGILSRE